MQTVGAQPVATKMIWSRSLTVMLLCTTGLSLGPRMVLTMAHLCFLGKLFLFWKPSVVKHLGILFSSASSVLELPEVLLVVELLLLLCLFTRLLLSPPLFLLFFPWCFSLVDFAFLRLCLLCLALLCVPSSLERLSGRDTVRLSVASASSTGTGLGISPIQAAESGWQIV